MNDYKNKVAWCPICKQGWVEIFKDKETDDFFVYCHECESTWEHPNGVKDTNKATSIFDVNIEIEEPTDDEIQAKGWNIYIIND